MGIFRKNKPGKMRDAAAQRRIDGARRRSFAPSYFSRQAVLFIALTIAVFFVDLVLFVAFELVVVRADPSFSESPYSVVYAVDGNLEVADAGASEATYSLDARAQSVLDKAGAWAMLVGADGSVLWSYNVPQDIAERTYTLNDMATIARDFYLDGYPTFFSARRDDGTVVVGFPIDSYSALPVGYVSDRDLVALFVFGIVILYLDALMFFMVYSFSKRRTLKSIAPAIEALDDLAHGLPAHMDVKGPLSPIAESVNAASAIMQRKDEARKRWISGVSHDVRTPLAISMGHAERIANAEDAPAGVRESGEVIVRQNERIRDLVEDLNIASRLEYDSQPMNIERVAPVAFAREIVVDYLNAGLDAQYELEFFSTPAADDSAVAADGRLLRRAVRNLVDNAMRHNGEGCRIALSVDVEKSGMAAITVADNGRGCDTAHVAALMAQASSPDVSYDAHGLGLTLVSRIALLHGGYVSFASEPSKGFTATIRIPTAE